MIRLPCLGGAQCGEQRRPDHKQSTRRRRRRRRTTKTTAADAAADIHEADGQARALYRDCDEPSTGAGQVANASKPESSSLSSRCSGWSADRGTMQHLGASRLIGELLAGVGAVCPRHLEDIEEVKAVTSGGSGGGGGAGAEFLVRVFKVFSLDRVQQRFVDQILGFVDVLVILQAVFQGVLLDGASDPVHRQSAVTSCVRRRREPTVQTVQKTVEIPQVLFVVDML